MCLSRLLSPQNVFYGSCLFIFALAARPAAAQRMWNNPCAGTPGADQQAVCVFLEKAYREADDRCGIVPISYFWPPANIFRRKHDWDVIPKDILRTIPVVLDTAQGGTSRYTEFGLPSVAALMTTVGPLQQANLDRILQLPAAGDPTVVQLSFNPLTDPARLRVDSTSESLHKITCSTALAASESGNLKVTVATASQKFNSQANQTSEMELVYGTFISPLAYVEQMHPLAFKYEVLDAYRRYAIATNAPVTDGLKYVSSFEGVIVYSTEKGDLTSDLAIEGTASAGSIFGSIDSTASADEKLANQGSATIFHTLERNATLAKLPSLQEAKAGLAGTNTLFSIFDRDSKAAVYEKSSKSVQMTFALQGMPVSMCNDSLWTIAKVSNPLGLTAGAYPLKLAMAPALPASSTLPAVGRRCVGTLTLPGDSAFNGNPIQATLHFAFDPAIAPASNQGFDVGELEFAYFLPTVKLNALPNPPSGPTSADFWYQIPEPASVDTSIAVVLPTHATLTCGPSTNPTPSWSASYAKSYRDPTSGTTMSGTFLQVQFQYGQQQFAPPLKAAAKACVAGGSLVLTAPSGQPVKVALPTL